MPEVIYTGPYTAVVLPDGTVCEKDTPVSVPEDVATDLINQGFKAPKNEKVGAK